jgi:AcrR family transcriptional regulator
VGPPVKRRGYDNSRRRSASQRRRAEILAAARGLFVEHGYLGTTMTAVAERAEVSLDTVYELVGRKPALFRMLVETAISGRDQEVPAEQRDYVLAIHAEPTAAGKLARYAEALPAIHARLAPLLQVVQAAASAEPDLARLWFDIGERRAENMRRMAAELEATGELAVPADEAADVLWATNSPELYLLLVHRRGWSDDRYGRWLATSWRRLLLAR